MVVGLSTLHALEPSGNISENTNQSREGGGLVVFILPSAHREKTLDLFFFWKKQNNNSTSLRLVEEGDGSPLFFFLLPLANCFGIVG